MLGPSTDRRPRLVRISNIRDPRGALGIIEASKHTGFDAKRMYFIHGVRGDHVRGQHAHKTLRQFIICLKGAVRVSFENELGRFTFNLTSNTEGVIVPPGCWRELDNFEGDAVIAVLASEEYSEDDYIRDYDEFKRWSEQAHAEQDVPYIPLMRQHTALGLELERALVSELHSGHYIGGGTVERFETEFAAYCGTSYFVGCGNGLDALVLALEALGIGAGDEVIVPANSFVASALAVSLAGATPVLVDVDLDTHVITPATVEPAITARTRAIMPVHLYGIPVDMDAMQEVARRRGLFLIEDAAQAHGATFRGRHCGSLGHVAGFSFYPTKVLGAIGDGGGVATSDPALAEKIRLLGNYGSRTKYRHEVVARNSRLDPIQAAVLSVKLRHLDSWSERRRVLAQRYYDGLSDIEALRLPRLGNDRVPAWHVFPILVGEGTRDAAIDHLKRHGIGTNVHYPVPIHLQPAYAGLGYRTGDLPNSERIARQVLSLPLDPFHTDDEIDRAIRAVRAFFTA